MDASCKGKITSIGEPYQHGGAAPSHVAITVKHGRRKRETNDGSDKGNLVGYHQPQSTVHIPKDAAKGFSHGDKVNIHLSKAEANDGDEDDYGDEEQAAPPPTKASTRARNKIKGAMQRRGAD